MKTNNKNIIILFPPRVTGHKLSASYIQRGFTVFLFTFDENDLRFYRDIDSSAKNGFQIYYIDPSHPEIPEDIKEIIPEIDITLNYVGSELLSLKVEGEDDEWHIDNTDQINKRFAFIDKLVKLRKKNQHGLWLNILNGKIGRGDNQPVFCPSRYSLMGLEELLKIDPGFANTRIVSVCTSFLKNMLDEDRVQHCAGCSKEVFTDMPQDIASTDELLEFIIDKSIALIK